jgi:hypothetical protein
VLYKELVEQEAKEGRLVLRVTKEFSIIITKLQKTLASRGCLANLEEGY